MASRQQDKAAEMLRRSLAHDSSAGAGDACPDAEILAAYFEQSLDPEETAHYELHFSQCARCREQLTAMDRAGELAGAGAAAMQPAQRWAWLWDWRMLAPVAAALLIAAVWIVRRPAPNRLAEQQPSQPLVAISQPSAPPTSAPVIEAPPAPPGIASGVTQEPDSAKVRRAAPAKSPAPTDKEEFAANLPEAGRGVAQNEMQPNMLEKDANVRKRDSSAAVDEVTVQAEAPPTGVPAAAARPAPAPAPMLIAPAARQSNSGAVGGAMSASSAAATEAAPSKQMAASEFSVTAQRNQKAALKTADVRSAPVLIRTPDPQMLWRISGGTFVERSIDGGANWKTAVVIVDGNFNGGAAPSTQVCWLVGHVGLIYLTTDADHWKTIPPPVWTDLVGVTAMDASSATVTAADGHKFTTSDAGAHWTPAQ